MFAASGECVHGEGVCCHGNKINIFLYLLDDGRIYKIFVSNESSEMRPVISEVIQVMHTH